MSHPPPPSGGGDQWGWDGSDAAQGHWPTPSAPPSQPPPPQQPPPQQPQGHQQPGQPPHQYAGTQPHPSGGPSPTRRRPGLIALVAVLVLVLGAGIGWGLTNLLSQDDTTAVAAPSEAPSAPSQESPSPAPSESAGAEPDGPGSAPAEDELPDDPSEALTQISETDEEEVVAELDGMWVPQISSKKAGMEIDGETWTDEDILADHQTLRDEHPRVRLVWSGNFGSFKEGDFWITIAGIGYSDPEQALSWCATNGLGPDDCYAKQLNTGGGHEGTTRLQ